MSAARKLRRSITRHATTTRGDRLDRIEATAPDHGDGKTAIYSVRCCWWSSDWSGGRTDSGLPCCPYCRSVLMQAPLDKFIASARTNAEHYGPRGLAAFAAAHNAPCHRTWEEYQ